MCYSWVSSNKKSNFLEIQYSEVCMEILFLIGGIAIVVVAIVSTIRFMFGPQIARAIRLIFNKQNSTANPSL